VKSKKILFIGAGDIVIQLFKYNSKFNFNNIYISNRSEEKAIILAQNNQCKTYPWQQVLSNHFEGFDVIISAASNCPNLVHTTANTTEKQLLIDLAVPCNIDKTLANKTNVIFHDLDSISVELEETKEHRLAAIGDVNSIITEEIESYTEWLEGAPLRALLAELKIKVSKKVKRHFETNSIESNIKDVTNQVMKNLITKNKTAISISVDNLDELITNEISIMNN
jgi:glutamyl-tRNA reductase